MNYVKVTIPIKNTEHSDILIAILATEGYDGFEETDNELKAFIPEQAYDVSVLAAMILPFNITYHTELIEQQNWNAKWESSFEPVTVNDFAMVRASFHEAKTGVKHDIIITPKMSFGTGHHATTYMMIEQMGMLDLKNKSVLDFGTGTGVLAILAEKMGAASVRAIDNDDWSIENAKENIIANHCSRIQLEKAEVIPSNEQYDIILANINLNVICNNMEIISKACRNVGTTILLSGFLKSDEQEISRYLGQYGNKVIAIQQKGEWLSVKAVAKVGNV
ncbi:MAG: 50S ribosomal protein L11 methyltransferase [Ferruginibacter sp.]